MPVCRPWRHDLLGRAYAAVSWEPHQLQTSTSHATSATQGHAEIDERATPAAEYAEKHRLTSSRQSEHYAARRAGLLLVSCSNRVASAAAAQECYCNLCYYISPRSSAIRRDG